MTGLDIAVIIVVALSALLAFFRGVVRELIALASWIAALFVAFAFEGPLAGALPAFVTTPVVRHVIAFVAIFVAILVVGGAIAHLLAKLVRAAGLGFADRFLGAVFGTARGLIIVVFAVLVAGLTALPKYEWWQNATLGPPLVAAALALRPWLPAAWAERLDYGPAGKVPARSGGEAARWFDGEVSACVES
jgi:membrane protein required for colicin V production